MSHRFDPTILREYDIRGIVGATLSVADARAIGRAFAVTMQRQGGRRAAVGDVVAIGRGPTPMLYYAAATLEVGAGIMVTGSHNPPEYNGFKFVLRGSAFYGAAIQALAEIAAGLAAPSAIRGQIEERDLRHAYVARLLRDFKGSRALTVAWDPGNGATGEIVAWLDRKS